METSPTAGWYVAKNGQQTGPFSWPELVAQSADGRLSPDDLIWSDGMADWTPARSNPGLTFGVVANAPAASPLLGYQNAMLAPNYAGFWWRFLAVFIDGIIMNIAGGIAGGVLGAIVGLTFPRDQVEIVAQLAGMVIGVIVGWLYEGLMISSSKQATLGKMACGLTVIGPDGGRISFGRASGRFFGKYLSGLILGIGYLMMLWSDKKQTLHDQLAGTYVLKKR